MENSIQTRNEMLGMENFIFTHKLIEKTNPGKYSFSGQIHPGITLSSKEWQSLRFPCFWFVKDHAILPAFGRFAGIAVIEPLPDDKVFALYRQGSRMRSRVITALY